jgi:hypothetical protein
MLSGDGEVSTVPKAVAQLDKHGPAFVRPDEDNKAFAGAVYDANGLRLATSQWAGRIAAAVIVASPMAIQTEWRLFAVAGEVVAASSYRREGRGCLDGYVPADVIDFGERLIRLWSPAPVFCLDIAVTGKRLGVVEVNCFNAARFYGADVARIVGAVSRYVTMKRNS